MAEQINIYINGQKSKVPPKNLKGLFIELNNDLDSNSNKTSVSTNNWEFANELNDLVKDYINKGVLGGEGILIGLPFEIEVVRNGLSLRPHIGQIDLTDGAIIDFESNDISKVNSKELLGIDWFNDNIDSFTFEYLQSIGVINKDTDYDYLPYIIEKRVTPLEVMQIVLTIYFVILQLQKIIYKISALIARGIVLDWAVVAEILVVLVEIGIIITALIEVITQLADIAFPKKRYHACMNVNTLISKACQHMGLTYNNSFLKTDYSNLYILPEKYDVLQSSDKKVFGFFSSDKDKQKGFYQGTFGQLLRELKTTFNFRLVIDQTNATLDILPDKQYNYAGAYELPDLYNNEIRYNTEDFKANFWFKFNTDNLDRTTVEDYEGMEFQQTLTPISNINGIKYRNMQGLEIISPQFSFVKRKTSLNWVDDTVKAFLEAVEGFSNAIISVYNSIVDMINAIISAINKIISVINKLGAKIPKIKPLDAKLQYLDVSGLVSDRIGLAKFESNTISMPRLFLMDKQSNYKQNRVSSNNRDIINARYLFKQHHLSRTFIPSTNYPNGNQWYYKSFKNVSFTLDDFLKVKNNLAIFTAGKKEKGIIKSLRWNPYDQVADIEIKISKLYTNNLTVNEIYPSGF